MFILSVWRLFIIFKMMGTPASTASIGSVINKKDGSGFKAKVNKIRAVANISQK